MWHSIIIEQVMLEDKTVDKDKTFACEKFINNRKFDWEGDCYPHKHFLNTWLIYKYRDPQMHL